jgi:hypothetical protein
MQGEQARSDLCNYRTVGDDDFMPVENSGIRSVLCIMLGGFYFGLGGALADSSAS